MKRNIAYSTYQHFEANGKKAKIVTTLYVDDSNGDLNNDGIVFMDDFQKVLDEMIESDLILGVNSKVKPRISKDGKIHHLRVLEAMEAQLKAQIAKIEKMDSR